MYKITEEKETEIGRFTVKQLKVKVSPGSEHPYSYVKIVPGVCILPIIDQQIAMIRQYRIPIQQWEYELPAGMIDHGEKPEEAAVRELSEETGLIADQLISLGSFYPSPGSTDEIIYLYAAQCHQQTRQHLDETEQIKLKMMPIDEFRKLIISDSFKHSAGIIAWARYEAAKNQG